MSSPARSYSPFWRLYVVWEWFHLNVLIPLRSGVILVGTFRHLHTLTHSFIGTTFTGLIAAFASPGAGFQRSMQVSMSHLFFNVIGACLWFVVPIMRQIPIGVARFAGRRTALYRWWAVNYIVLFFFVLPVLAFVISIFSEEALVGKFSRKTIFKLSVTGLSMRLVNHLSMKLRWLSLMRRVFWTKLNLCLAYMQHIYSMYFKQYPSSIRTDV